MKTAPTIRVLTLQQANKAGLKQSVTYRAKWPSQRWELEPAVATLLAGNIAAAIVIVSGTEKHGIADVRRVPVKKTQRPLYQQIRAVGGSPKLHHTKDGRIAR